MMMKAAEMAGTGNLPGNSGHAGPIFTQEQLLERAKNLRALSEMAAGRGPRISAPQGVIPSIPAQTTASPKTSGIEDLSVQRKRKSEGEELRAAKKRQEMLEAEESRQRVERERIQRMQEQQQLKEKLAQEGMGDVTVVLPDAPPMEATDLSTSAPATLAAATTSGSSGTPGPSSSSSSMAVDKTTTLSLIRDNMNIQAPPPPPAGVG
ncbi:hypothetical protein EGW08_001902, partial [Elysia chlorotica]